MGPFRISRYKTASLVVWFANPVGIWDSVLSEVSFLEALIRATIATVGFVVASGSVLAVMGILSGRD